MAVRMAISRARAPSAHQHQRGDVDASNQQHHRHPPNRMRLASRKSPRYRSRNGVRMGEVISLSFQPAEIIALCTRSRSAAAWSVETPRFRRPMPPRYQPVLLQYPIGLQRNPDFDPVRKYRFRRKHANDRVWLVIELQDTRPARFDRPGTSAARNYSPATQPGVPWDDPLPEESFDRATA